MEETTEQLQVVDASVVYEQDKAAIDVQISTAKAYPRNITKATNNALAIATVDLKTAQTCTYAVPRGGKKITGPSVHLAKILAQCWGNLRVEAKVVAIDARQVTSEAVCFDLENNLAIKIEANRLRCNGKSGRFSDDMITVTGNAANSIALRNAVLSVIPRGIVDKVYEGALKAITGDLSDETKLIAKRKKVIDGLKDTYSVTEAEILSAIGKAAVQHITPDDIVTLIGIGTAIKDGDTTVAQAFRGEKQDDTKITWEQLDALVEEKEPLMGKELFDNAKRILDNKEEESYRKLFDKLTDLKDVDTQQ